MDSKKIFGRSKSKRESCFDIAKLNKSDDPIDNLITIFSKFCQDNIVIDYKLHISYLNVLVSISSELNAYEDENIYFSIFSIVKFSLWSDYRLVRTAGIRCLRYYMHNCRHMNWFLEMRLDFLLMRSMDLSFEDAMNCKYRSNEDAERIQTIRLIYKISLISPRKFPYSLISLLTNICLAAANCSNLTFNTCSIDLVFKPGLMILCQLISIQPDLSFAPGVLPALQTVTCPTDNCKQLNDLNFRIIEAVLLTQLKLVTQLPWRQAIPRGYFHKILAPFSSFSPSQPIKEESRGYRPYEDESLNELTYISILTCLLQSWSGILYFTSLENRPIVTLLRMLDVGETGLKNRILDLLYNLFNVLKPSSECQDFISCLQNISEQVTPPNCPNWSLDSDFLVGQVDDCLPYLSPSRLNLADNYQALLLGVFIQNGLFEVLASAISDKSEQTSARAGILLGFLLYQTSILLPSDHPIVSHRTDPNQLLTDSRCSKALHWLQRIHQLLEYGALSSSVLATTNPFLVHILQQHPTNLQQHHNHGGDPNNSEYLPFYCNQFLQPDNIEDIVESAFSMNTQQSSGSIKMNLSSSSSSDFRPNNTKCAALLDHVYRYSRLFDNVNNTSAPTSLSLTSSLISSAPTLNLKSNVPLCNNWDWDLLLLFSNSLINSKSQVINDKDLLSRTLKILLKFLVGYQNNGENSAHIDSLEAERFISLPITWKHSNKAAFVLGDIVVYLLESIKNSEIPDDLITLLIFFRTNLIGCLSSNIDEKYLPKVMDEINSMKSDFEDCNMDNESTIFIDYELNYKCSCYLFLVFGRISSTDAGEELLEKFGIVQLFRVLLMYANSNNTNVMLSKLIIAGLDYTRPSLGRSLLSVAATSYCIHVRRYTTKFLRVLLRSRVPFFATWGVNILLKQLCDNDRLVFESAVNILMEACEDESVINNLTFENMNILHKGYSGYLLMSRLLTVPYHFEKFIEKNSLELFLDNWKEKYNLEYCEKLDDSLMQYYTNYEPTYNISEDPDAARPSSYGKSKQRGKELLLQCHPYGSLAEHKDGLDILIARGYLQKCMVSLTAAWRELHYDCCCVKKAEDYANLQPPPKDYYELDKMELELRSSMLAVSHVASTIWGLEWAVEMELPVIISDLARLHTSFNVRGTGFICLGLIGSTRRGVTLLNRTSLWSGLRSDRRHKWPLLLDVYHQWQQSRAELRRRLQQPLHQCSINSVSGRNQSKISSSISRNNNHNNINNNNNKQIASLSFPSNISEIDANINNTFVLLQGASSIGYSVFAVDQGGSNNYKSRTPTMDNDGDGGSDTDIKDDRICNGDDETEVTPPRQRKVTIDYEMDEEELQNLYRLIESTQLSTPKFHSKSLDITSTNAIGGISRGVTNENVTINCSKSRAITVNSSSSGEAGGDKECIILPWKVDSSPNQNNQAWETRKSSSSSHNTSLSTANPSPKISFVNNTITPYDVIGIATIRRLQKKISRPSLFNFTPKNNQILQSRQLSQVKHSQSSTSPFFNRDLLQRNSEDDGKSSNEMVQTRGAENDNNCMQHSKSSDNMKKSNPRMRKKFSSVINPRGHLNKYRGLVVPTDFNEFTQQHISFNKDGNRYDPFPKQNQSDPINTNLNSSNNKTTDDKLQNVASNIAESQNRTSGYLNADNSNPSSLTRALLDIDTLTIDNSTSGSLDLNRDIRSNSDHQDTNYCVDKTSSSIRPRATTIATSPNFTKENFQFPSESDSNSDIISRNTSIFIGDNLLPKRHKESLGLIYHEPGYCLSYLCQSKYDPMKSNHQVTKLKQFRYSVLQAVNSIIVLGPKSKKLELTLAQLKSQSQTSQMWSDACLYSELCILFTLYNFSRESRQFIQELFLSVSMFQLQLEMKYFLTQLSVKFNRTCSINTRL